MVRKIQINISNKSFYSLVVFGVFILLGIGVYAYGTSDPVVFGHSAGELEVTDTNTNADTQCTGTDVYLDGEGNCDSAATIVLSGGGSGVVSSGLYGWCLDDYSWRSNCIEAKSPAYCNGYNLCDCPSGYTLVKTGYWTESTSDAYTIRHYHYSCYKD